MKTIKSTFLIMAALLLLGAKSCEVKDKRDIIESTTVIEAVPEIGKLIDKFDIKKYNNQIRLVTCDNTTFRKTINLLESTPRNDNAL